VVIGGMLAATLLAIFLVPVTFSIAERFSNLFSSEHNGALDMHGRPHALDVEAEMETVPPQEGKA
jgi:hypothetical protein